MKRLFTCMLLIAAMALESSGMSSTFMPQENSKTIDYSEYAFVCGGASKYAYDMEPTEVENQYVVREVPMTSDSAFYLYNFVSRTEGYVLFSDCPPVTPSETATLYYYDASMDIDYIWYMGCDGFDGLYDVTVDFNGDSASMTFERTGDFIFDPLTVVLMEYDAGNICYPSKVDDHTAVYKNLCYRDSEDAFGYLLSDYRSGKLFGVAEDAPSVDPENPTAELICSQPLYWMMVDGFEGVYDLTVVYNEDFTGATLTFTKQTLPDGVGSYDGNLYLIGEYNDWMLQDPEYKMTCVAPGLYKWEGESLGSGFKINNGTRTQTFPGTDIPASIGGYRYPSYRDLKPGEAYNLLAGAGSQAICFVGAIETLENVKVTLDLREMTLLVTGRTAEMDSEDVRINVTIENGTQFSIRSRLGASEFIRVSTNDPFWSLTGVEMNGDPLYYDYPVHEVDGYFVIPDDNNLNLLFFTEYTGECQVIDGSVGTEVTFDNNVVITRVAEGVEVRNLEEGGEIAVYTLGGRLISLVKARNEAMTIKLEKGDAFIVRAGNVAAKVMM